MSDLYKYGNQPVETTLADKLFDEEHLWRVSAEKLTHQARLPPG